MTVVIVVVIAFTAAGSFGVYYGISLLNKVKNAQSSDEYREVEGVVADFREEESYDSDTGGYSISYYPIIEYYVNGSRYTYTEKVGSPSRRSFGRRFTMLYCVHDPSDAVKKGDRMPYFITGISAAFILIALVLLFTQVL